MDKAPLDTSINLRMTEAMFRALKAAAARDHRTLSEYLRLQLMAIAEREGNR